MSTDVKEVGTVVVGLGIAGKVRVRDLNEERCGLRLKGFVSRRQVDMEGVKSYTFDEALADKDVQAMMICTEPCMHEEYVRRALENGKHVLVEYPLALSSEKAKDFFNLAEEKGVILHEENIAMQLESYLEVKEKAKTTKLESAKYSLKGKKNGWIEDFNKSGLPFICGIGSLEVMSSLFGELKVTSASLNYEDDGYTAHCDLQTTEGSPISITQSRYPDAARFKQECYTFVDGTVIDFSKGYTFSKTKKGLFAQDMDIFYDCIQDGNIPKERKDLTISSLLLAEKIHSHF